MSSSFSFPDWVIRSTLSPGRFATLSRATRVDVGGDFVLKIVNGPVYASEFLSRSSTLSVRSEADVLASLSHPAVVRLRDSFCHMHLYVIVTDFFAGGDLCAHVLAHGPLDVGDCCRFGSSVCEALIYLQSREIVHRDVKPYNILMSGCERSRATVAVADFGFARSGRRHDHCQTYLGTPTYMAPEILETHRGMRRGYGHEVDVWSFGVLLYTVLSAMTPFESSLPDACLHFQTIQFDGDAWLQLPTSMSALVEALLRKEPSARLSLRSAAVELGNVRC